MKLYILSILTQIFCSLIDFQDLGVSPIMSQQPSNKNDYKKNKHWWWHTLCSQLQAVSNQLWLICLTCLDTDLTVLVVIDSASQRFNIIMHYSTELCTDISVPVQHIKYGRVVYTLISLYLVCWLIGVVVIIEGQIL